MPESSQDYDISREQASSVLVRAEHSGDLQLVKDSFVGQGWQVVLEDRDRRSFSYVLRQLDSKHFSQDQLRSWFDRLHPRNYKVSALGTGTARAAQHKISWTDAQCNGVKLLRKTAWCTLDADCICNYEYADTNQRRVTDSSMLITIREITDVLVKTIGLDGYLNSVNLNYYPTGGGVGFHADDEAIFDGLSRDTAIVSLSLCEQEGIADLGMRRFEIRLKRRFLDGAVEGCEPVSEHVLFVNLGHGDILTMEGLHQLFYLHSVWPGDEDGTTMAVESSCRQHHVDGERINLTWRRIVNHDENCPVRGRKKAKISQG